MKLEFKSMGSLCSADIFIINGVEADSDDFGNQDDLSPDTADDYGCGNMQFTPIEPAEGILQKYGLTYPEYWLVANMLKESLSFGDCGLCS